MAGHADRGHSPVGPSQCERFWACPGSVYMAVKHPEYANKGTSKAAAEGTRAHEYAEFCIKTQTDPLRYSDDYAPYGKTAEKETFIPNDMAVAVKVYVDLIQADLAQYGMTLSQVVVEATVDLTFSTDEAAVPPTDADFAVLDHLIPHGSCDAYFVAPDNTVHVYDYKHGVKHVVSARENKQMMYYAAGVSEGVMHQSEADKYVLKIVQPRADTYGVDVDYVCTYADIKKFRKDLCVAIVACSSASAKFNSGDHCTFCGLKTRCPAKDSEFETTVSSMFEPVLGEPMPAKPLVLTVDIPRVSSTATPTGVAEYLTKVEKLKDLLDSLYTEAYNMASEMASMGVVIPGHELVAKKSNRKWMDEDRALEQLNALGIDAVDYKVKSPAQVEKQLKQAGVDFNLDTLTVREVKDSVLVRTTKIEHVDVTMFKPLNS